jgi:hypothetical protein
MPGSDGRCGMFLRKGFRGSSIEDPRSDLQVALYSRKALSARSSSGEAKQAWRNLLHDKNDRSFQ